MKLKEFNQKYSISSFRSYSILRWIALLGAIVFILASLVFFFSTQKSKWYTENIFIAIWLNYFGYFTIQSNIIVGVYFIWYWINPNSKKVNGNFLTYMVSYIFVTFALYSGLLLPSAVKNGSTASWGWVEYYSNIFQHFIIPVIAFVFYGIYVGKNKNSFIYDKTNYWWSIATGMIYPCCYALYAAWLPLMSDHQYSVYDSFTNLDHQLVINGKAGSPFALIYIYGAIVAFFAVLCLFRLGLNKKTDITLIDQPTK